ncbi:hypothetical protein AWZ03_002109 [Drosophila navojoa]|uniref:Uncharacterized protein n=1 Tax=Drosophila navojoa TaxID=7232 RepID=A0A484BS74_DRONA|nr:hypothetical protein AWZ03_002109 [Drosophila navojoa]
MHADRNRAARQEAGSRQRAASSEQETADRQGAAQATANELHNCNSSSSSSSSNSSSNSSQKDLNLNRKPRAELGMAQLGSALGNKSLQPAVARHKQVANNKPKDLRVCGRCTNGVRHKDKHQGPSTKDQEQKLHLRPCAHATVSWLP